MNRQDDDLPERCPTWCALAKEYGEGVHAGPCDPRPERVRFQALYKVAHLPDDQLLVALERQRLAALAAVPRS